MKLLLRAATIIDPRSPHHNQTVDLLIEQGKIARIGKKLKADGNTEVRTFQNLHVSPGWFDSYAHFCDPGEEHKEDLTTGMAAAMSGGFTDVLIRPDTQPALESKGDIEYILTKTRNRAVAVHPMGALTEGCAGENLTEIFDLEQAGAVAFSNAEQPLASSGMLLRGMQYVLPFGGVIVYRPLKRSIADGPVNEGMMSVTLGMKGSPAIAEELAVYEALELAKYTTSKLHLVKISTAKSVGMVREAKKAGIPVTASVSAYHLLLDERVLEDFDENYKVTPPLRTAEDVSACIKGLKDGIIDCICSDHTPQDIEAKQREFEDSADGMITLESAFGIARKATKKQLSLERLIEAWSIGPRSIFGLETSTIEEGAKANLTLFDPDLEWTLEEADLKSKSRNTPFIGKTLTGRAFGTIRGSYSHHAKT